MLKLKRIYIPVALIALYTALGFLAAPRLIRWQLRDQLTAALNRPVAVGAVSFNPYALEVVVHDFAVTERDGGPFVAVRTLRVNASFFSLVRGRLGFDAIEVDGLKVAVTLLKNGSLSIADLLESSSGAPAPDVKPSKPLVITIAELVLTDGGFTFHDLTRAEPFTAELSPLALSLSNFTTATGHDSRYAFNAQLGPATVSWDGDFSARPLKSAGRLSMQGIDLTVFQPYLTDLTQLSPQSGVLGVEGRYRFDASAPPARFVLEDCRVKVDALKVGGPGEQQPVLELERLTAEAPRIDLAEKTAVLEAVVLKKGIVRARREQDGQVQLARLARPGPRDAAVLETARKPATAPSPTANKQRAWSLKLARFALEDWALQWDDLSLEYPSKIAIDQLGLELSNLTWPVAGPIDTRLAFRWQERGRVAVEGPFTPEPLAAALAVDLHDVSLIALDGYLWDAGFNGTLEHGLLGAQLKVKVADAGKQLSASGSGRLGELALLDSEDRPLLSLRELALDGVTFDNRPAPKLTLAGAKLSGFKLEFARDEQGVMNVAQLARPTPLPAPAAERSPAPKAEPGPGFSAAIGVLDLDDFNLNWFDKQTRPAFASSVRKMSGRITGITWPVTQKLGVKLSGRVDQAPLRVTGTLLPIADRTALDMKVGLAAYDLPRGTPYSVRYVAQPIDKGKLSLDVTVKIAKQKLDAQTHFVIDQLDFGDRVDSPGPDATLLPLGLAVAVLSDRHGRIDLELPVMGDLADPEFKWGGILWKTLLNLMAKVSTAPFTLLAGLFSGGDPDTFKFVGFAPGATAATDDEAKKLDTLARILADRPRLKLELTPGADEVADRDALARRSLERSLTAHHAAAGAETLSAADYQRLLTAAWKKANPARPGASPPAAPPFAQMEADLLARQVVTPEDYEALRHERAAWCQSGLEGRGVPLDRVFVVQPSEGKGLKAAVDVGLE